MIALLKRASQLLTQDKMYPGPDPEASVATAKFGTGLSCRRAGLPKIRTEHWSAGRLLETSTEGVRGRTGRGPGGYAPLSPACQCRYQAQASSLCLVVVLAAFQLDSEVSGKLELET